MRAAARRLRSERQPSISPLDPERGAPTGDAAGSGESGVELQKSPQRGVRATRETDGQDFLQFSGSRGLQVTPIVIGVDFGTSCTKVVCQSPYKLAGRAVVVPFEKAGHPSCCYFLPTRVGMTADDHLLLTSPAQATTVFPHLKVGILDQFPGGGQRRAVDFTEDPSVYAAGYLALTLRETRRWFLRTQSDSYRMDRLRWSLNLGVPSAGYDDEAIRAEFEAIAKTAWQVSLEPEPFKLQQVSDVLRTARAVGDSGEIHIRVIPEVAAQVVGYAKSRYREEGLHVLVDLGASTLDICSFLLWSVEGVDTYKMLTADVTRLGLLNLHHRRMTAVGRKFPFDRVPEDLVLALPRWDASQLADLDMVRELKVCDDSFTKECVQRLCGTIRDLRMKRDPLSSRWKDGLPVFVAGGGAHSTIFANFVPAVDTAAKGFWNMQGVHERRLPVPPLANLDDLIDNSAVYTRLGVAYGLSVDEPNIGPIERPSEIDDLNSPLDSPKEGGGWEDRYISKDQV